MSADAQKPTTAVAPPAKTGSSLMQRLSSFLVGLGVGSGMGYYHLTKEVEGSTATLLAAVKKSHTELSERITKLEESS
ncbi:unnamed protein product [Choristocarpus tenellus]